MSMDWARNRIISQMFVASADKNYILAREAFFFELENDFWWLSLHAAEKYLKAILLFNGEKATSTSHNVVKLYDRAGSIRPGIKFAELRNPAIDGMPWLNTSLDAFLERLNTYGSPSNRYSLYGHSTTTTDLAMVDQLLWGLRRYCRAWEHTETFLEGAPLEIDWVIQLQKNEKLWRLHFGEIERTLDGKRGEERKARFLLANRPFAPTADHPPLALRHSGGDGPFVALAEIIREPTADAHQKAMAANAIKWALDHIHFSKGDDGDKHQLQKLLEYYECGAP